MSFDVTLKNDEQYISTEQLCEWLGLERDWVYDRISEIPHAKFGRLLRFKVGEIKKFIDGATVSSTGA